MKARLEFDLTEGDECEFRIASTAMDWALTVYDIDNELRTIGKYGSPFKTVEEAVENIRNNMFDIMQQRNISLDIIE